jgi:hypothetical protein
MSNLVHKPLAPLPAGTGVSPIIAFLDFLFVFAENLQASSIEPSIGRRPNVIHATDSRISI